MPRLLMPVLIVLLLLTAACGKKGPLYLPDGATPDLPNPGPKTTNNKR